MQPLSREPRRRSTTRSRVRLALLVFTALALITLDFRGSTGVNDTLLGPLGSAEWLITHSQRGHADKKIVYAAESKAELNQPKHITERGWQRPYPHNPHAGTS